MLEINVKEARSKLSVLLTRVVKGEKIIITRHGKKIAGIVPLSSETKLPSLKTFRDSIEGGGETLSRAVIGGRNDERY